MSDKKEVKQEVELKQDRPQINIPDYLDSNYVLGKFDPAAHKWFTKIDIKYADRQGLYLHKEAYDAFKDMWSAAKEDGVNLTIRSATRNFGYQKSIWQRKWNGEVLLEGKDNARTKYEDNYQRAIAIMRFSAMPGTSRHHWGTDIDLNAFVNDYFESGKGLKEYEWLLAHAEQFGFVQVYTNKEENNRTGYEEEKWHWSYKPISSLCQMVVERSIHNNDITGFDGSGLANKIDVKTNYIFGIDKSCY